MTGVFSGKNAQGFSENKIFSSIPMPHFYYQQTINFKFMENLTKNSHLMIPKVMTSSTFSKMWQNSNDFLSLTGKKFQSDSLYNLWNCPDPFFPSVYKYKISFMIFSIGGTIWKTERKKKLFKLALASACCIRITLALEITGIKKYILNNLTLDNRTATKQLIFWCSGLKKL